MAFVSLPASSPALGGPPPLYVFLPPSSAALGGPPPLYVPLPVGGGGAFVPTDLGATLKLWLEADIGITQAGGFVSAWADQSGNGNNFSQGTGANQPAFTASAINGKPAVTFDGVTTHNMTSSFALSGDGPLTIVIVRKLTTVTFPTTPQGSFIEIKDSTNRPMIQLITSSATPTNFLMRLGGAADVKNAGAQTLNTAAHADIVTFAGGDPQVAANWTYSLDGTVITVLDYSGGAVTGPGVGNSTIGSNSDGIAPVPASQSLILVCNTALTGTNLTNVKAYTLAKYGV